MVKNVFQITLNILKCSLQYALQLFYVFSAFVLFGQELIISVT